MKDKGDTWMFQEFKVNVKPLYILSDFIADALLLFISWIIDTPKSPTARKLHSSL
jgi:hypothetical protein